MTNVETHKAAIRSDMLAVAGNFGEEQIAGREGREALATALRDVINERLVELEGFGGVEGVFFTSFVLQ
jgi:flagellar FliL protein